MFAIGGICPENLSQVQAAGFTRVAVSSAILDASSPRDAAIAMLSALQN
jgi:thiamine monophosphate synthase